MLTLLAKRKASVFSTIAGDKVQEMSVAALGYQRVVKENRDLYNMVQDLKEASNSSRNHSDGSSVATVYDTAPRSPTSACHSRIRGTESRIRRPIQLPKTPEPPTLPTKVVGTVIPSEFSLSRKSQTPGVAMSTMKKGSIRKSLMTIRKLINAPNKRNQQHPVGTLSHTTVNVNDKSTPAADARTLRRQSLTGGQTSGLSRRSSLGGNDSCSKDNQNARAPPPVHPSTIEVRRWF
ncbi:hypothetical protein IFM89_032547 [Coptis chinensis]|uniref:Uncharacterized protein n=1 Tax=Coptis chinensis TaxID=261450 RepID=A0A835M5J3_9MAGN|nr:hypothetical protein IFM89_032547 [Coptis chinensis]